MHIMIDKPNTLIIQITQIPNMPEIVVKEKKDLVKLAEKFNKPILLIENATRVNKEKVVSDEFSFYSVVHEAIVYTHYFNIKPGKPKGKKK